MTIEAYGVKQVVTASPEQTLSEAASALRSEDVGCVVATEAARPVGVLTDRDLAMAVLAEGRDLAGEKVGGCMQSPPVVVEANADLREAIALMSGHGVRRLPIVDGAGALAGLVAADDLVSSLIEELIAVRGVIAGQSALRHEAVSWTRAVKDHYEKRVVRVPQTATAAEVARTLHDEVVGCAVVVDAGNFPVGMLTDRDLMKRALETPEVSAGKIMSQPITTVESDVSLEQVVGLMRDRGFRRIPVVRHVELSGLVSLDDILVAIGRELSELGTAFRHAIARAQRDQRLERVRDEVFVSLSQSIDRAEKLGERAQDRLIERLTNFRKELRLSQQ